MTSLSVWVNVESRQRNGREESDHPCFGPRWNANRRGHACSFGRGLSRRAKDSFGEPWIVHKAGEDDGAYHGRCEAQGIVADRAAHGTSLRPVIATMWWNGGIEGAMSLEVTIVPDSGTGELTGIHGKMAIEIVDGKHFYELDYQIA